MWFKLQYLFKRFLILCSCLCIYIQLIRNEPIHNLKRNSIDSSDSENLIQVYKYIANIVEFKHNDHHYHHNQYNNCQSFFENCLFQIDANGINRFNLQKISPTCLPFNKAIQCLEIISNDNSNHNSCLHRHNLKHVQQNLVKMYAEREKCSIKYPYKSSQYSINSSILNFSKSTLTCVYIITCLNIFLNISIK